MSAAGLPAEWLAIALVALRLAPSGIALTALSRGAVPIWFGLSLALSLAPLCALGVDVLPLAQGEHALVWIAAARELCLGASFALAAALPWLALTFALRALDASLFPGAAPALMRLYVLAALALAISLGAHRAYFAALGSTFTAVPIGPVMLGRATFLSEVLTAGGAALSLALSVGVPLWLSLWLVDMTLGLVSRAFGEAPESARSPLRGALGLLLAALLLAPVAAHSPEWVRVSLARAGAAAARLSR